MDFLKKHGEKLFFVLCLLGLAGSLAAVMLGGDTSGTNGYAIAGEKSKIAAVEPAVLDELLARIQGQAYELSLTTNAFTSAHRRLCVNQNDPALIPVGATHCPFCGSEQTLEDPDTDLDGVTDKVERQYGMNPNDPKDVELDMDKDGFPNGLEITNGFDPTDAQSHPPLIDGLRVNDIEHVVTSVSISGQSKGPTRWAVQIAVRYPGSANPWRKIVNEGDSFGRRSEFKMQSFTEKREFVNGRNRYTRIAKIQVGSNTYEMSPEKPLEIGNSTVDFELLTDPGYEQSVRVGETFKLDGKTYIVLKIDRNTAVIQSKAAGSEPLTIRQASADEKAPAQKVNEGVPMEGFFGLDASDVPYEDRAR